MQFDTQAAVRFVELLRVLPDDDGSIGLAIRESLMYPDTYNNPDTVDMIHNAIATIAENDTDTLSMLRLEYSLCPLHGIDYAICFDDGNPECSAIRQCFPGHDS